LTATITCLTLRRTHSITTLTWRFSLAAAKALIFRFNRRNTPMGALQTLLGISTQQASLTHPEPVNRSQP